MAKYSDINISFKKNTINGDMVLKEDLDAIKQSISNILTTRRGELPYNLDFGSKIEEYLFEKINTLTEMMLVQEVEFALGNNEPRITLVNVWVDSDEDGYLMDLNIEFRVKNFDNSQQNPILQLRLV